MDNKVDAKDKVNLPLKHRQKSLYDIEFKHMIQELILGWWKKHTIEKIVGCRKVARSIGKIASFGNCMLSLHPT